MIKVKKSNRRIENLNGATGLIITTFSCIVTLFTTNIYTHALFTIWLFILLIYFGLVKHGLVYLSLYIFSVLWLILIAPKGISFPSPMLFSMMYKLILPIMPAVLTIKIPSGKVLAAMRKIPISKNVMLVLVVLIRFAPTVSGEFKAVREAMKIRGFIGRFNILFHPLKTLEYAVVPMVFRSLKVADELAAASIVRGIENPCPKESYYICKFTRIDVIILLISFLLGVISIGYKGGV
ncbi:energy-coupling factor transporter transmembrane protein EcfT [Clostridium niameyense]|uniref:Energy-coupling factor transporter transmembrane protein EcfT n=1 Tax=Clostridium niameyense TaxID=1622073 RepID=A0A6M0RCC6_9CLOT|nr:energy-coupling factor transporter transmembrane component T [Clostridium niameyense]NEZ47269.1 energy-coupling factor transporter transmembrane protein EcfT [Clostridium niameyense]